MLYSHSLMTDLIHELCRLLTFNSLPLVQALWRARRCLKWVNDTIVCCIRATVVRLVRTCRFVRLFVTNSRFTIHTCCRSRICRSLGRGWFYSTARLGSDTPHLPNSPSAANLFVVIQELNTGLRIPLFYANNAVIHSIV
jgi:hypothetical protein